MAGNKAAENAPERPRVDTTWREQAACKGHDPEYWFEGAVHGAAGITAMAIAICMECPVRAQCLAFAQQVEGSLVAKDRVYGIYGGLTAKERRCMVRRAAEQANARKVVAARHAAKVSA